MELQRALHATAHARSELRHGIGEAEAGEAVARHGIGEAEAGEAVARYRALVEPANDARAGAESAKAGRGGGGGSATVAAMAARRRAVEYDGHGSNAMGFERGSPSAGLAVGLSVGMSASGGRAEAESASMFLARSEARAAGVGAIGRHEAAVQDAAEEVHRMQVQHVATQAAESGLPGSGGAEYPESQSSHGTRKDSVSGSAYDLGYSGERSRGSMVIVDGGERRGHTEEGTINGEGVSKHGPGGDTAPGSRPGSGIGTRDAAPSYFELFCQEQQEDEKERQKKQRAL